MKNNDQLECPIWQDLRAAMGGVEIVVKPEKVDKPPERLASPVAAEDHPVSRSIRAKIS